MTSHVVQQGECLATLAERYGIAWQRIWSHAANHALWAGRRKPNILVPGDVVHVPDRETREEPRPTDQRHRFQLPGYPIKLRIRLLAAGTPVKNEAYVFEVAGSVRQGRTDGDGKLEEPIPASAMRGVLLIGKERVRLELEIGSLDPIAEVSGAQARLHNLGYFCGEINGQLNPPSRSALLAFQETYRLTQSGQPDTTTRECAAATRTRRGTWSVWRPTTSRRTARA